MKRAASFPRPPFCGTVKIGMESLSHTGLGFFHHETGGENSSEGRCLGNLLVGLRPSGLQKLLLRGGS